MTEVYMPWEAILKIGMNGVNSSDDEMEIITNYTSVAHTTSYEKDEWYPLPGKGRKTSMVISKEDLLEIKFKSVKDDPAGRYLISLPALNIGNGAMTRVIFINPYGFKYDGSATVEISDETYEGNKVSDVSAKLTYSADCKVTDTLETEEGA